MNGASGLGCSGALLDGPGTAFFFAGGEERLQTEGLVGGFDELAEGVIFHAVALEKFFFLLAGHAGHFFFEFSIDKNGLLSGARTNGFRSASLAPVVTGLTRYLAPVVANDLEPFVLGTNELAEFTLQISISEAFFVDIEHINDWLFGEIRDRFVSGVLFALGIDFGTGFFVGELELKVNNIDVVFGLGDDVVYKFLVGAEDVVIFEGANDMADGLTFADVSEEFVAETLAF